MLAAALLALAPAAAPATAGSFEVRLEMLDERVALVVDVGADAPGLSVSRDGGEVVLRVDRRPPTAPRLPAPRPPLDELRLVLGPERFELRARVAPVVLFEVQRSGTAVSLVFGALSEDPSLSASDSPREETATTGGEAAPAGETTGGTPGQASFEALYRSLFAGSAGAEQERAGDSFDTQLGDQDGGDDGWRLGPLRLRPALLASWVDGETTVGPTPRPVRDDYFQIEPRLGAYLGARLLGGGWLRASYEPTFRTRPALAAARRPAHELNAQLDQPLGSALSLRAGGHWVWDVLDTTEVDPGREYFYSLGRYRRERYTGGLRFKGGGRLDLDLSGSLHRVRFREEAYFFDHERRTLLGELGYELSPNLRAGLGYTFEQVPPTAGRAAAESRGHGARLALYGEPHPLWRGELALGYERRHSPRAGPGGERFRGWVALAQLTRELSHSSNLSLAASRYTTLSAFESNAFYIANQAELVLTLPLPLGVSARGGVGVQRNEYRVAARVLNVPRRDTLYGWTAGLGRSFGRWSFARADYRRDRRDSNLNEFDTRTWTLIVQLGLGYLGRPGQP